MIVLIFSIIISSILTKDCNQYEFENEQLVLSPWNTSDYNPETIITDLSGKHQVFIDTTIYQNRHVENTYDTLFNLRIKNSKIEVYKTSSESWINETELNENLIELSNGLGIGCSRKEFLDRFSEIEYKNCSSYKITGLDGVSWIDIYFAEDKVSKIYYSGYND